MKSNWQKIFPFCYVVLAFLSNNAFSTDVPPQYIIYSTDLLSIHDRAGTHGTGWVGSATAITIGIDAAIEGNVLSSGNLKLSDRCSINGDVKAGGSISIESGVIINGTSLSNTAVPVYTIPLKTFQTGTQNITVHEDSSYIFSPGNYGDIYISSRAKVVFQSGVYNVKSLKAYDDILLKLDFPANGKIEINSSGDLSFGDRVKTSLTNCDNRYAVSFYSGGTNIVNLGYDGTYYGSFIAPNALVIVHGRSVFVGTIYSKMVDLEPFVEYRADTTKPTITIIQPSNGSLIATKTPRCSIKFGVSGAGIDPNSLKILVNGTDRTSLFQVNGDSAVWQVQSEMGLFEGQNVITASISDRSANTAQTSSTFDIDITAPIVNITSPVDGQITNRNPVTVAWTVDGVSQTAQLTEVLTEGTNTITRTVTDAAWNTGTASVHVTLDTHAPVAVITSPTDGLITNRNPATVAWAVDGVSQTAQLTENLTEGTNTITRTVTDAAGNTGTVSVHVTLDTHAPEAAITSPTDGLITNCNPVTVCGPLMAFRKQHN